MTNTSPPIINKDKEEEKSIVGFLRSDTWAFVSFLFLVTPLMVHTASLILKVSGLDFNLFPGDDLLYSTFFALGFDTAILTFALSGREKEAKGLAWVVFLLNFGFMNIDFVSKYNAGEIALDFNQFFLLALRLILAGAGAYIVHAYVKFFLDRINKESKLKQLFNANYESEKKIKALENELEERAHKISNLQSFKNEVLSTSASSLEELTAEMNNEIMELVEGLNKKPIKSIPRTISKNIEDEKPFECEFCHKPFKRNSGKVVHENTCSERPK